MVTTFTLSNGIHVVTYQIPQVKSVHLSIAIKGGSLVEETEKNGIAHFMEHMIVQGIPSFPTVESLATHVEGLAGSYNAYTSQLTVAFLITLPFIHIEQAIKIASEVVFSPLFPVESIEKERTAVINEITQRKDSLGYKLGKAFKAERFSSSSLLKRDIGGSLAAVKKLTREDMLAYWKTYFVPKNAYLYIGGNFSEKELRVLLEKYFSEYQNTQTFTGFTALSGNDFQGRKVVIKENQELGTNYVAFSFPSMGLDSDWRETAKQDVALTILGQLRTSRLFTLLRYQKGLVYSVSSQRILMPGVGYIDVDCEVTSENVTEVISLIAKTVHALITTGPTDKELSFVKDYYMNSWLMAFDNPGSVADWLEEELLWEHTVRTPDEYIAMLRDITKEDIMHVMKKYWDVSKLQLLIQGPFKNSNEHLEKLTELLEIV